MWHTLREMCKGKNPLWFTSQREEKGAISIPRFLLSGCHMPLEGQYPTGQTAAPEFFAKAKETKSLRDYDKSFKFAKQEHSPW